MKQSILIVDDTIENIDVLKAILMDDYNMRVATSGLATLKIAEKFKPEIILLDIMMPGMDGYEVCRRLKENPVTANIPVIFVTAMHEDKDEAKGFKIGAVDYITKPINPMIVKARIRTHLALANQQRELDIQVKDKTLELQQSRLDLIQRLGVASDFKDHDTGLHISRMSKICKYVAEALELSEKECDLILNAAPMHDIGKIGIEDKILLKPGKLDEQEWKRMQEHCKIGNLILRDSKDSLLKTAAIIALQHHEKWNGKGYPAGLKGEEINLFSRIVAIADVFDALTSVRPYKKAWAYEDAFKLIKEESGKHFDPQVVKAFILQYDKIVELCNKIRE